MTDTITVSGPPGMSAYQLAVLDGYTGSLADFLATAGGNLSAQVSAATAAATLAGHLANDAGDVDIPGAPPGQRGAAFYLARVVADAAPVVASALRTAGSPGKWLFQIKDRYGRIIGGWHSVRGFYDPGFPARAAAYIAGLAAVTFGGLIARQGRATRYLTRTADRYGRTLMGWDTKLKGFVISRILRPNGTDLYAQVDGISTTVLAQVATTLAAFSGNAVLD